MKEQVTMEFPGLGIGEFTVNKVAFEFSLFGHPISVRWYGIIITVGIILAFAYAYYRSKQEKISVDDLLDLAIFVIIFGILGARTYYVLTTLKDGIYHSFLDVIAIWNGGLAIYGGLIAGVLTIFLVCRKKKISFWKTTDMIAPGVMIGQILGRWGNFFNGEAYGYKVAESSPLYFLRMGLLPNIDSSSRMYYYHPTFLYESVWNLVGFLIINALYKRKKFDGQVLFMYISWYGFGRMFIEGLRTDSLYVGPFRISQVVGFACFVFGTAMIIYNLVKVRKAKLAEGDYEAAYPQFKTEASMKGNNKKGSAEENTGSEETDNSKDTEMPDKDSVNIDRDNRE